MACCGTVYNAECFITDDEPEEQPKKFDPAEAFDCERLAELKETFVMLDKCQSEKIQACLIGKALRALGQNPSNHEISKLLEESGKSGKEEITFDEFAEILSKYNFKSLAENLDDLINAFKVFDYQEVGMIDVCELRQWLEKSGEALSHQQVDELIKISGSRLSSREFDYNEFLQKANSLDNC